MKLTNVKLIFAREVRDQLRDRRTLMLIVALPLFLYPLLGASLFQIAQFVQDQVTEVLVVGADNLPGTAALFDNNHFAGQLFGDARRARLLDLRFAPPAAPGAEQGDPRAYARAQVQAGKYAALLYFPPDFARRLQAFRRAVRQRGELKPGEQRGQGMDVPGPEVTYNAANDSSRMTFDGINEALGNWKQKERDEILEQSGVSARVVSPFSIVAVDVGDPARRRGAMWSKMLPVLLVLWALTGAFYPAIDLCAGEKERGTLETLLVSPAARSEIVAGKLMTVMLFSAVTALLNLVGAGLTGALLLSRLPAFGLPPAGAIVALGIALLPIAALFSCLCLGLAAMARSTKEGQYYLMPLLLATVPLAVLPMSPGVQLNLGNSLVPVTGVVLLLRSMLEGEYWQALQFAPIVVAVTLVACLLSARWAVDQFHRESVLFREGERMDVRLWLRYLLGQRRPTPTAPAALACGVLILVVHFALSFWATTPGDFDSLAWAVLTTQLVVIAAPALMMTLLLTNRPRRTLLLKLPPWRAIPAAVLLAVLLAPLANRLQAIVQWLYPVNESLGPTLEKMSEVLRQVDFWPLVLVIAILPAVCEELAFRGFILSGFRDLGHRGKAVIYSALLFGLSHGILQQSLIAALLGVVLGYLAVQTGSILPCMVFHAVHNTLAVAVARITPEMLDRSRWLGAMLRPVKGGCMFPWQVVLAGALAALLVAAWFARLSPSRGRHNAPEGGNPGHRGESAPEPA